jgi:TolB protein
MSPHTKFLAITFFLSVVPALAIADDFPLKKVSQLTRLVDYEASWSPDSRFIVLISNRHGGLKVHVLDASSEEGGRDMRQVTSGPDEDDSPAWSPDGRTIAFVCIHGGVSDICIVKPDGSDVRQVTRGFGQNIHPMWSPDGSRILFNTTYFAGPVRNDKETVDEKRVIGET